MAGKLLYSRVLQNKMQKNQALEQQEPEQKIRAPQFYVDGENGMSMDRRPADNHRSDNRSFDRDDRSFDQKGDGNKIRRGPGRRIAKEKRMRNMDPALMQKYASLPENLQEKVNAMIQICYQQYMANVYKTPGKADQSHYNTDIEIDAESDVFETQDGF